MTRVTVTLSLELSELSREQLLYLAKECVAKYNVHATDKTYLTIYTEEECIKHANFVRQNEIYKTMGDPMKSVSMSSKPPLFWR